MQSVKFELAVRGIRSRHALCGAPPGLMVRGSPAATGYRPTRQTRDLYVPHGMALQKRFFDHFLKGEQNGWDKEPRVWLNLRQPAGRAHRPS